MKILSYKKSILFSLLFFFVSQQNYSQLIYNWFEYYIKTSTSYIEANADSKVKTLTNNSDKLKLSPLCTTCKGEVWILYLSPNIYSERPDSEYYGYIKNKLTNKFLTYNNVTGQVTQKAKLPEDSDQSQRWYVGYRFTPDLYTGHRIIPFLDTSKNLNYETNKNGVTNFIANTANLNWDIIPTQPVPVTLENIRGLCPTKITRGDREFAGHGPQINLQVTLSMQNDNTEIWANIAFKASETVYDWSTVEGNWDFRVYTAPAGRRLKDIVMDKTTSFGEILLNPGGFELFYNSNKTNHNYIETLSKQFWSPVQSVRLVGDTGGPDISYDDDCNDDTRIDEINFRQLYVIFE